MISKKKNSIQIFSCNKCIPVRLWVEVFVSQRWVQSEITVKHNAIPTTQTSRQSSLGPQAEVTPPPSTHQRRHLYKCTFSKSDNQANLKELCNWGINVQVNIQILQKKTGFGWNRNPWGILCRECFSNTIPYLCC